MIEFELRRTVPAPAAAVFARLADFGGYADWMPEKGSILRRTHQTSPGEPRLGTTFLDETKYGATPGEIVEFDPPHTLVFHWWESTRRGSVRMEGWPGYRLEPVGETSTVVRHHATLTTYGAYRLATPVLRRLALRERTATIDALTASFAETR